MDTYDNFVPYCRKFLRKKQISMENLALLKNFRQNTGMFTGIIESTAEVLSRTQTGLTIARPQEFSELKMGQSIAVNGACLSVSAYNKDSISFDVVPETFARTNLGAVELVNLERALSVQGRFEGHIVSGHIDQVSKLLKREKELSGELFTFELPAALEKFLVEKGSITLNGISLTIAILTDDTFSIAIIPQTLEWTNLGLLEEGDAVNVEVDIMGKYLYKWRRGNDELRMTNDE